MTNSKSDFLPFLLFSVLLVMSCAKAPTQKPICYGIEESVSTTLLKLDLNPDATRDDYNHDLVVSEFANGKEVAPPMTIPGRIAEGRYFILPDGSTFEYTDHDFKLAPPEKQNNSSQFKYASPASMAGLVFLKTNCP